jgi:hypothetical protein
MDGFVFWTTAVVLALFGVVIAALLTAAATQPGSTVLNVALVASAVFVAGIAVYAYAYAPKAFHLGEDEIRVERPAGDVRIPLASVFAVTPLDVFLGLSLKALPGGNSGLFGLYGNFWRRDIGKFQLYARRANHTVLLETDAGAVVIAPERRDEFIARVREASRG